MMRTHFGSDDPDLIFKTTFVVDMNHGINQ